MNDYYFSKSPNSKVNLYTIKTNLKNQTFQFLTSSGIFSPKSIDKGTRLLIETIQVPNVGNILDLGSGYGPIGIVVAAIAPESKVYMIDQNERAIWLAKENIKKNAIQNAEARIGGLEVLKKLKFDLIISNPPLSIGYKKISSLLSLVPNYLNDNGNLQIVLRKTHKKIISIMENIFTNIEILKRKSGYIILKSMIY
ncbi:MAG: class I SAM-dependent methyltransferase [Candidatus Helarchaeota archaeon]